MSVKVLFVDDEEGNLLVSEAVCGDDFEVLTARSGAVALELLRAYEIGVIVSDQRMPEMSGVELLEKVQAEFPECVRLLVTAYSDVGAAIDAINRGRVRRYLKKPWEPEELKAEVADALERYLTRRQLRELERRLVQTERVYALGIVAAGIGHELRNPISWITTNLQHSLAELGDLSLALKAKDAVLASAKVDEIRAALQDASMGAERVAGIVSAIQLSMLRPAGESEIVDLEEVVHLALRLVEGDMRRAGRLDLQVSGSPRVRGSRTQLSQIVVNLLINAVHAVAKLPTADAVIAVRIGTDGKLASLEVADCGPGVPEQDRERIFDPFFTTKPGVGTGLGLAISRKIAAELGGTLEVERDGRLGGAVFRLTLPTEAPGAR
jgi:C4-dicarboxylate-specific signal transduction histidine kinase